MLLRGRCRTGWTRCSFCVAAAAFIKPGRCHWSPVCRGRGNFFGRQVKHSVITFCFCVAGADLRKPGRLFLRSKVSLRPRILLLAGAVLGESGGCLWSFCVAAVAFGAPDAAFVGQVKHSVHRMLVLGGRCSTQRAWALNGLCRSAHPFVT